MHNLEYSIFFSYTIRDGLINKELLRSFKNNLNSVGIFNTYIDLVDNDYIENPQLKVLENLSLSSIVFIIDTPYISKSPWVIKELNIAKSLNIPILSISFSDFQSCAKCKDITSLYHNPLITYIINSVLKI